MNSKPFTDFKTLIDKKGDVPARLKERDFILYWLIPINAIVFMVTLVMNFMASMPEFSFGLFTNGITNVSRKYESNITPIGETFAIWSVIYLAQIVSGLYGISLMLRFTANGLAYANPPVLSRIFYLLNMIGNALNITWLFVFDREMLGLSFLVLVGLAAFIISITAYAAVRQRAFRSQLLGESRTFDIGMINIVVVNGCGIYAGWTLVAAHVNFALTLIYDQTLDNEVASLVSLSSLIILFILYTGLDVFLFGRYTRSLLSPYGVLLWASAGIAASNFDSQRYSSIAALVFAVLSFFVLLFKVTLLVLVPRFRPSNRIKDVKEKWVGL